MPLATSDERAVDISYAATAAASGNSASVKPAGTANEMPTSGSDTFGGGHVGNMQELPVRATEVPSGQMSASTGHAIGCKGRSIAFRYTNPPMPIRIMAKIPRNRLFMYK